MAKTKHKYRCTICGYGYDRDEIILDHKLSPICTGDLSDQETLDMDEVDFDGIADQREEIKELQELERRNHEST